MRGSVSGFILACIYVLCVVVLLAVSYFLIPHGAGEQVTMKGWVIVEQLTVAPAMMLLTFTGLIDSVMRTYPWMNSYYVLFAMSLAITYLIGWGVGAILRFDEAIHAKRKDR